MGIADIQRWLDAPALSEANRDALRTMAQQNPGIGDALKDQFAAQARRFTAKSGALSLARQWSRAGALGLVSKEEHDRIGGMIAKRAITQNRRGTIPWLLTDDYAQVPGLNTPAAETIIAIRTVKHAAKTESTDAADLAIAYLMQHPDNEAVREQTRLALPTLRLSAAGQAAAASLFQPSRNKVDASPGVVPSVPQSVPPAYSGPSAEEILDQIRRDNEASLIEYERSLRKHQEFLENLEQERRRDERMRRWERERRHASEEAERRQREEADRRRADEQRAADQRAREETERRHTQERMAIEQRARAEADRKRAEEQRAAEQRARAEADRKRAEEQRATEQRARAEADRKRAEEQRAAEQRTRAEADRKRAEEQRAAEQRARAEADRKRAEEQRAEEQRATEQRARAEADRKRVEEQRAAEQRARAEADHKRAEEEKRAAELRAKIK